jgi:hypothetical protein
MQIIKDTLFHISDFLSDEDAFALFRTCKEYTELLSNNKKWYKIKKTELSSSPLVFLFQDNLKGKNEVNPSSPTNK